MGQNGIVKPGDHLVEVQYGVKLLVLKELRESKFLGSVIDERDV